MNPQSTRLLNLIQLIVEICVGAGYLLGLIPFLYLWSSGWVIPLAVVSLILSIVTGNGRTLMTLVNVAFALLGFIPVIGYIPRMLGIFISFVNIAHIRKMV